MPRPARLFGFPIVTAETSSFHLPGVPGLPMLLIVGSHAFVRDAGRRCRCMSLARRRAVPACVANRVSPFAAG